MTVSHASPKLVEDINNDTHLKQPAFLDQANIPKDNLHKGLEDLSCNMTTKQ